MSQITESAAAPQTRFGTSHTIILWNIIIIGGIIFPSIFFGFYGKTTTHGFFLSPFPWVTAGGWTIDHGLKMFSGITPEMPTLAERLGCLSSLTLMFVILPTLFFFGLRRRAIERRSGKEFHIVRWSSLQFVVGGIGTLGLALASIPIALTQLEVSSSLHHAQAIQQNKDVIINELNIIAWKLYEYRVLPKELAGGNGTMTGFKLPQELTVATEATYQCRMEDTLAVVKATSLKYPLASITVKVDSKGKFSDWNFGGCFE
jgi:hypothetical protein